MAPSILQELYNLSQALRGCNPFTLSLSSPSLSTNNTLPGKWLIITGSNTGIGLSASKSFAKAGLNLILACRHPPAWEPHPEDAVKTCKEIARQNGYEKSVIEWWEIDMADLKSVEGFARRWIETGRTLDFLSNNAGIPSMERTVMTKDGYQIVHQVNFLSHVLLTHLLLPSLCRSPQPRIICTTSLLHHCGQLTTSPSSPSINTNTLQARFNDYHNSKLHFQIYIALLQSRFLLNPHYKHITINGVNPGFVKTHIWRKYSLKTGFWSWILGLYLRFLAISEEQGGLAIVNAVMNPKFGPNPKVQGVGAPQGRGGGLYINRIWEAPAHPSCRDKGARDLVWRMVDEELHLKKRGLLVGLEET